MTVGFHSPLPPAATGVADYAAALLRAMRWIGPVNAGQAGDVDLYHLGNNPLHGEIYRRALARPGVVVLHDAVLHHFFLGRERREYVEEFAYNYGEWSRALAERFWRDRARSAADVRYFRYPMLRRIVEASRAVIVHNRGAARMARSAVSGARVVEIPHLFESPSLPSGAEVARLRARWGVLPSDFVFGVFGHLRESKRLFSIARAFSRLRRRATNVRLLIVGEFVSQDLARSLAPVTTGAIREPYLAERDFWIAAHSVDACISLRYPAAGETSGITIRLMGAGKPVLVTAGEETADLPEAARVAVDSGAAEEDMLAEAMEWLARFPGMAREIGRRAASHIAREHAVESVAVRYWETLRGLT